MNKSFDKSFEPYFQEILKCLNSDNFVVITYCKSQGFEPIHESFCEIHRHNNEFFFIIYSSKYKAKTIIYNLIELRKVCYSMASKVTFHLKDDDLIIID